jgi:hypothetical protein
VDVQKWDKLGEAVKTRRTALRLAQTDLMDRGGPGDITVRKVERGEVRGLRTKTKAQLEVALLWPEGMVDRILNDWVDDREMQEKVLRPLIRDTPTVDVQAAITAGGMREDAVVTEKVIDLLGELAKRKDRTYTEESLYRGMLDWLHELAG